MTSVIDEIERLVQLAREGALSENQLCTLLAELVCRREDGRAQPRMRWEYKDLTVPLNMTGRVLEGDDRFRAVAAEVDTVVLPHLQAAVRVGWEPDEPTDFASLWDAGRVAYRSYRPGWTQRTIRWNASWNYLYDLATVTLRLRRLIES